MKFIGIMVALGAVLTGAYATEFGTVPDSYTGIWSGRWTVAGKSSEVHAHVVRYKDRYEVKLRPKPDSRLKPLAGFHFLAETLKPVESMELNILDDAMSGTVNGAEFDLKRVNFKPSPTLGKKAPEDAVVIFDGSGVDALKSAIGKREIGWKLVEGGAIEVSGKDKGKKFKQDIRTRAEFGDYELHAEFKLPYMVDQVGQQRANSGIFHYGLYETQVLDSFGLYGKYDEAGGIYKIREPDSNAVYPPGLWQTYDVIARAARFDAQGKKIKDVRLTVRLNGVLIHEDVAGDFSKLTKRTAARGEHPTGPIIFQDHANPVQYRNIWVRPL
ncbi:3-keto-disaccharide hydrolase [Pontiella agarivorans]|uniref:DUF1080 domain-containing protein n=1 Tax=Pontiella agarivorans TaxID=3038953 RepID=A0ABU5MUD7_9BACT|nr:DUF1080 domain-containing protein [Pontiella agarivorans]MDZ8117831.1 DUF1080 domain-containing protein [Pontiella agarivorans]